ncbi:MAG: hypothetical protein J6M02_01910 [Clostridia bacterium]|nr:hypothetical protein [Clostridia bacterium]
MKKYVLVLLCCLGIFCTGCGEHNNAEPANDDSVLASASNDATTEKISSLKENAEKEIVSVVNEAGFVELKFKNTNSDEYIRSLNGKKVTMTGYLSVLSPINGKFAYLMNLPYQSCPYCVPGTSAIYNTLAIYAKQNEKIEFTNEPVTVEGVLEVGNFKDDFEYEYSVRIKDATVKKADVEKLSENILMYSAISQEGLIDQMNYAITMLDEIIYYDYYETYYGMSPDDLTPFDTAEIDKIISKLKSINESGYSDIIKVMENAKTLAGTANDNLAKGNYEKNKSLQPNLDKVFAGFSAWMAKYEM